MQVVRNYKIEINASAQKVWFVLWDLYYYRKWVSAFNEGSYAKTDNWKEGSIVHFLGANGDGIYTKITENKEREKMYFTHLGDIKNFIEKPIIEGPESWSGSRENYTLSENNGITTLIAEIDALENHLEFFDSSFPKAFEIVKSLAEDFYITVETIVESSIDNVWEKWNNPEDIINWYTASDEWHTPTAINDLKVGGQFDFRMEAKDGSMGFNFVGEYIAVNNNKSIEIVLGDDRIVKLVFEEIDDKVQITEQFEPEYENSFDLQRFGWQSILNNFRKYVESTNQ